MNHMSLMQFVCGRGPQKFKIIGNILKQQWKSMLCLNALIKRCSLNTLMFLVNSELNTPIRSCRTWHWASPALEGVNGSSMIVNLGVLPDIVELSRWTTAQINTKKLQRFSGKLPNLATLWRATVSHCVTCFNTGWLVKAAAMTGCVGRRDGWIGGGSIEKQELIKNSKRKLVYFWECELSSKL